MNKWVGLGDTMGLTKIEDGKTFHKLHAGKKAYWLTPDEFLFWMIARSAKCTIKDLGQMLNISSKKMIDTREFLKRKGLVIEWSEKTANLNALYTEANGFVVNINERGEHLVRSFPQEEPLLLTDTQYYIWRVSGQGDTLTEIKDQIEQQVELTSGEFLEEVRVLLASGLLSLRI